MELFYVKGEKNDRAIALDDLILTTDLPTTGGSRMLDGYVSLFEASAVTKLREKGYSIAGKCSTGEFGIDLLGETSYKGATEKDGKLVFAPSEVVSSGEAFASLSLDVNGAPRRGAAASDVVAIKPTYGIVSRFGVIGVVSSGEALTVTAQNAKTCKEVLDAIVGHDDMDGTSLPEDSCKNAMSEKKVRKVACLTDLVALAEDDVKETITSKIQELKAHGIEVCDIDSGVISKAGFAWNILMSAEACNNVSRFDGVKYGYRSQNFTTIDELYTASRTEAFGDLIKKCILFGSETLSTDNYMPFYDKSLRIRRVIKEAFDRIFSEYDAVLLPVASKSAFAASDLAACPTISYRENRFTAPASITGLPAVVFDGVQMIGPALSDGMLLGLASELGKEEA